MNLETYPLKWPALWLAIAWSLVIAIVYLSLAPIAVEIPASGGDKYAHVLAYAALMLSFMQIFSSTRSRIVVAVGLVALGIGLEFIQGYTGYRTFERADMAADVAGVAIGWLIGPPRTPNILMRVEKVL